MYTVFIPKEKGRYKTNVRGFWKNDSGKIFYDYMTMKYFGYIEKRQLEKIKEEYNQEAIFLKDSSTDTAWIYHNRDKSDMLRHRRIFQKVGFFGLKKLIKELLNKYSGLTVYETTKGIFQIEVWTNENN